MQASKNRYYTSKQAAVLPYSDLISLILNVVLLIQMSKMIIPYNTSRWTDFVLKAFTRINSNESILDIV